MNNKPNTKPIILYLLRIFVLVICFLNPLSSFAQDPLNVDALYSATLNAKEIVANGKKLIKQPLAIFPEFRADLDGQENIVNSVKQGFNILHYDAESGGGGFGSGYFLTRLNEFNSSEAASKDFFTAFSEAYSGLSEADELQGQTFGDGTRYLMGNYGKDGYYAQYAFFRVKNISGFIRINTRTPLASRNVSDYLARYIAVLSGKVDLALNGRLPPIFLPSVIKDNLPSDENTLDFAKLLGTAASPAEAWANIDSLGDFTKVKKQLISGGAKILGYRQYQISGSPSHIIEITLFPFRSQTSALKWFDFSTGATQGDLNPGNTGSDSSFVSNKNDGVINSYELMFAKGKMVADIYCYALDGNPQNVCERETRTLGERWFSQLP